MAETSVGHIVDTLYPHDFQSRQGYSTQGERLERIVYDALVLCNTQATSEDRPLKVLKGENPFGRRSTLSHSTANSPDSKVSALNEMLRLAVKAVANKTVGSWDQGVPADDFDDFDDSMPPRNGTVVFGTDEVPPELQTERCAWWLKLEALPEDRRGTHFLFNRREQDIKKLVGYKSSASSTLPTWRTGALAWAVGALVAGAVASS